MVAFATTAAAAAVAHATRSCVGSLHRECDVPNQDAHAHCIVGPHVFLVLDGHGPEGDAIATRAAHTLLRHAVDRLHKLLAGSACVRHHAALRAAFAATAELVDSQPSAHAAGTTASAVVVERDFVTVANVGDSDVVLGSNGVAKLVSFRHRPTDPLEQQRVLNAGAVVSNGYVSDTNNPPTKIISITRTFGDLDVRSIGIIPTPQIATFPIHEGDFVILATDGLWDAHGGVTPQAAVDLVHNSFQAGADVHAALDQLVQLAKGKYPLPIDDLTITLVRRNPRESPAQAAASS
ncbi:unnamed protein product [Agarophyton chilense]